MRKWLWFHYRIAREPSAHRVRIWRKLKQLRAVLLHDAVWVLPSNARTRAQFQWLAPEIVELDGDATMWEAQLSFGATEGDLIRRFIVRGARFSFVPGGTMPGPENGSTFPALACHIAEAVARSARPDSPSDRENCG